MLYDEEIPILEINSDDSEYKKIKTKFSHYDQTYVFNGLVQEEEKWGQPPFMLEFGNAKNYQSGYRWGSVSCT